MLQNLHYLRQFDGGGSSNDGIAEELGQQREETVFFWDLPIAKRSESAAEIDPENLHLSLSVDPRAPGEKVGISRTR